MTTPTVAQSERAAIADLFAASAPDAPTLCEGWTAFDLAAHLVVREHRPLVGLAIVVPSMHGMHDKAIAKLKARRSYDDAVAAVRNGPPLHWKPVDKLFNTQEYFIHHEDLRRGGGDTTPRPAEDIAATEQALWDLLARGTKYLTRSLKGITTVLDAPGFGTATAARGEPTVHLAGRPGEITLYLSGRRAAADVQVTGDPDAVAVAQGARLGI